MPGLIDDYGRALERRLAFDQRLASRAREEVESHLRDAALDAADERDAIRRFGDPDLIAGNYAAVTLPGHARIALVASCLLAAVTFLFMRLRAGWLFDGLLHPSHALTLATAIDRIGFCAGALLCLAAWQKLRTARNGRVPILLLGAASGFGLSIAASLYRASLALSGEGATFLPYVIATGAVEVILLGYIVLRLRNLNRHALLASRAGRFLLR